MSLNNSCLLDHISINSNIGYYNRSFIRHMFNDNIRKYCNYNKKIEISLLEKNLDNLENRIKIITNKYNVEKNIFKL
ncbi:hypothetical protein CV640_04330 [Borreliella burgdorferi]|nr:hypothetical protein CV682_04330 [Borreliella burgdorferi]PRR26827.1 hypothetical protein CV640_04330 [Borreliella burgdorferi]PRR66150.1 hypothetical protein CV634_04330 [Borreliella burgdorferi]